MILFRLISWPYCRRHRLRTILTTAGVVLGIAVFVAMRSANQSVLLAFSQTVDRIAGKTELQVSMGETAFPEDVLERVQSASTVRVAVPVIETLAESNFAGQGSLLVLGIDMTGDRSLREYDVDTENETVIDDPLIFLAQPDSLLVSKPYAQRNHLNVGSHVLLETAGGTKTFTVRGVVTSSGLNSAFGGNLAVMDIYAAQKMFGRGRTFDRIDLAVKRGVTLADSQRELRALLGPGFDVQPPSGRGQQFESLLAGYSMMARISGAFALFIGMFIIYNSFAIAVAQRRAEIGILRALGATRRQIRRLFLAESVVLGLIGSIAGLVIGLLISRAIASWVSRLITDVYGVAQRPEDIDMSPVALTLAVATGIGTSMAAAILPAAAAARTDVVQALQKGSHAVLNPRQKRLRLVIAVGLGALSVVCLTATGYKPMFYAGYALTTATALLLTPMASVLLAKGLRPLFQWMLPVEGALAADSLISAPRRTAASVAAVMLSLALVVGFSGMALSSVRSILDWMHTSLTPDLFVLPSQNLNLQGIRFPSSMGEELTGIPGVERVQPERDLRVTLRGSPVMVVAFELASIAKTDPRPVIAGDPTEMYRRAAAGEGLIVADNLAERLGLRLGDQLEIPAPYGDLRLPIVGVVVDYSDQQGAVLMDRRLFVDHWHDESANAFRVFVGRGSTVSTVREQIIKRYSGVRRVFVLTNDELKTYIMQVVDQWFGLTRAQIGLAVLIAVLGIANTLSVSIIDRRRELGVLRAVGASANQIRKTVWLEALGIASIALALGCSLGLVNLYYILYVARHEIVGMRLDYQFPVSTVLVLIPAMLGAGFVAALWPAESAVRGTLLETLAYE